MGVSGAAYFNEVLGPLGFVDPYPGFFIVETNDISGVPASINLALPVGLENSSGFDATGVQLSFGGPGLTFTPTSLENFGTVTDGSQLFSNTQVSKDDGLPGTTPVTVVLGGTVNGDSVIRNFTFNIEWV